MGRPTEDLINTSTFQEIFGYSFDDVKTYYKPARFGIVGPMKFMKEDAKLHPWAIHVWGVNLEKAGTADYKEMIAADGNFKNDQAKEKYKNRQVELLEIILRGALYAKKITKEEKVIVRMLSLIHI